jgi:excisionase family DNA binding protein
MENMILTSVPMDQLQAAISEAVKTEFLKFSTPTLPEPPAYITRKETAEILGVSLVTLNDWSKAGIVPFYRIGTRVRYKKEEVLNSVSKAKAIKYRRLA